MSSWRSGRKMLYLALAFFFGVFAFILIWLVIWYQRPNCSDGIRNQDELGVDCGGRCPKVCTSQVPDLKVDWVRFFRVKSGIYSVAAYVENPNDLLDVYSMPYSFKFYSEDGVMLKQVDGTTYVPPAQAFGIFEGAIDLGFQIPARVEFVATQPKWHKYAGGPKVVAIKEQVPAFNAPLPRLTAQIENTSLKPVKNIVAFAVVYGYDGNAIAASKTVIDSLPAGGSGAFIFSWPESFGAGANRYDILHWVAPLGEN